MKPFEESALRQDERAGCKAEFLSLIDAVAEEHDGEASQLFADILRIKVEAEFVVGDDE